MLPAVPLEGKWGNGGIYFWLSSFWRHVFQVQLFTRQSTWFMPHVFLFFRLSAPQLLASLLFGPTNPTSHYFLLFCDVEFSW
jgi:hypothetical protein